MIDTLAGREREIALVVRRRAAEFAARRRRGRSRRSVEPEHRRGNRRDRGSSCLPLSAKTYSLWAKAGAGQRRNSISTGRLPAACPTLDRPLPIADLLRHGNQTSSRGGLPAGPAAARQPRFRSPNLRSRRPEHGPREIPRPARQTACRPAPCAAADNRAPRIECHRPGGEPAGKDHRPTIAANGPAKKVVANHARQGHDQRVDPQHGRAGDRKEHELKSQADEHGRKNGPAEHQAHQAAEHEVDRRTDPSAPGWPRRRRRPTPARPPWGSALRPTAAGRSSCRPRQRRFRPGDTPCPARVAVRMPSPICIARPHFPGISTVLTHISPPNSTSTGLPSGFFIFSSPEIRAAKPHQPARGIV